MAVKSAMLLDVTTVSAAASDPAMARPIAAAGCYTMAYFAGGVIHGRRFSGAIGAVTADVTLVTPAGAPSNLSVELESAAPPALVWQVGSTIYLGWAMDSARPTAAATPTVGRSDGASTIAVVAGPYRDSCGVPVAAGTMVTVVTTLGSIADADADAGTPGVQVAAGAGGMVAFTVRAPSSPGMARVTAFLAAGGPMASVDVPFTIDGMPPPDVSGDGGTSWSGYTVAGGGCAVGAGGGGGFVGLALLALVVIRRRAP
jgi:MYXO-CTERM domain-containing protein